MNILVVGCGKVGTQLSNVLSRMGHDVSVIDQDPRRLAALPDDFTGYTVTGVPIDQDVLRQGGIEGCDAVAAVTDDDNTNLMVCKLADEVFHVPRVLARVYDPQRGDVFSHFGLHTVCPTNISVEAIYSMLTGRDTVKTVYLDSATVAFNAVDPTPEQVGKSLGELAIQWGSVHRALFGLLREDGNLSLAYPGCPTLVEAGCRLLYAKVVD